MDFLLGMLSSGKKSDTTEATEGQKTKAKAVFSNLYMRIESTMRRYIEQFAAIDQGMMSIDALVEALLVKNHLNGTQIDEILSKVQS